MNNNKAIKLNDIVKGLTIEYLNEDYSPEQIAGKLKKDGVVQIHHETIYGYKTLALHETKYALV